MIANNSTTIADREKRVYEAKIRYIRIQGNIVLLGMVAVVILLYFVLFDSVDQSNLNHWCYGMMSLLIVRFAVIDRWMHESVGVNNVRLWKLLYYSVNIVTATAWVYLGWVLFPQASPESKGFIGMVIIALTGGAIVRNAVLIPIVIIYCAPMIIAATIRCFMAGDPFSLILASGFIMFAVVMTTVMRQANYTAMQAIFLNEDLKDEIEVRKRAVAELKTAKESAESATRLKDQFVTLVTHDLRSPLSGIVGSLKSIYSRKEHGFDEKRMFEGIGMLLKSSENLYEFVSKLLDINRLQTGHIQLRPIPITTKQFVASRIDLIAPLADQKGVVIVNTVPNVHKLFADPELIGEAFTNILSNAVKFSFGGGMIEVFVPGDSSGCISVRDNGTGVNKKYLADIFRHEVKTTDIGTKGERGTGLGLPHSIDIVRAHGGKLTVDSIEGEGSTFTITLPNPDRFILIADDQPAHREIMRDQIKGVNNIGVMEADDGIGALVMLESFDPDLIISDLNMPGMDGFELIKKIRMIDRFSDTPVIVASSLDWEDRDAPEATKKKVIALGANEFILKPIDNDSFQELINSYLGSS